MDELKIVMVPKDLYYHEVAYVRGLEARTERLGAALRSVIASEAYHELEPRGYIVPDQVMQWARAALAGKEE